MVKFLPLLLVLNQYAPFSVRVSLLLLDKQCHYTVTSHSRTVEHNRKVGGADSSYHLQGRAIDVLSKGKGCKQKLKNRVLEHGFSVIEYKKHLHIDDREEQVCLLKKPYGFKHCPDK